MTADSERLAGDNPDRLIPWAPRIVRTDRIVRIPVRAPEQHILLEPGAFRVLSSRWSAREAATFFYLQAPLVAGIHSLTARVAHHRTTVQIDVRELDGCRRVERFNGLLWPRRWPLGQPWHSTKMRQTFLDFPEPVLPDPDLVTWWQEVDGGTLLRQLPPAELPRAHFVNLHQGCPRCGAAVFRHGGFYPWLRRHRPCDFRSICPSCGSLFPSNDLANNDFGSGSFPDDGFGYFDSAGNIFLFAATYAWEQQHAFVAGIRALTRRLRRGSPDPAVARRLALMLLCYAAEEVYLATAAQFRYGVSHALETAWDWGQPDWASQPDPLGALTRKGSLDYSEATPHVAQLMALAYDAAWPALRWDGEFVAEAEELGLPAHTGDEAVALVEEMLAVLLQSVLDRAAGANKPSESLAALMILRALDRPDAQDVLGWLYDEGPDQLSVFTINNFFSDGFPPESTGDYNGIHTDGFFALEHHLRALRALHPGAYPEHRFPSLTDDPRTVRIARTPHEVTLIGKSWFQFGDGDGPGSNALGIRSDWFETSEDRLTPARAAPAIPVETLELQPDCVHTLLDPRTLDWAGQFTGDPGVGEIRAAAEGAEHRAIGTTIHEGVGLAILRTGGVPERAAAGVIYGDPPWHRHMDLLDVQLFAFGRPFLVDLGYPRTWATRYDWEANWATHNGLWGTVRQAQDDPLVAGRGRLVRTLFADGAQLVEVEAERWGKEPATGAWRKLGVRFRRLIGLIETVDHGIILLDLGRIKGGDEHWRVCRGLEGRFAASGITLAARPGTVANPAGQRGETTRLQNSEYRALAYMDQVDGTEAPSTWRGSWHSRIEPAAQLDVHQLRVSAGVDVLTARATSITGTPEQSDYDYRALLWRRKPADARDETMLDLLFEPRLGEPVVRTTNTIPSLSGASDASGVEIGTRGGESIRVYWAPGASPDTVTTFAGGIELHGALAVVRDQVIYTAGVTAMRLAGREIRFADAVQRGAIAELERRDCTIEVTGLATIQVGDRIRIDASEGGHSYGVAAVEATAARGHRIRLDMSSVLGRGQVWAVLDGAIELRAELIARTGNLHGKRLIMDGSEAAVLVTGAANTANGVTTLWWEQHGSGPVPHFAIGAWVSVVDYIVGDVVVVERLCTTAA